MGTFSFEDAQSPAGGEQGKASTFSFEEAARSSEGAAEAKLPTKDISKAGESLSRIWEVPADVQAHGTTWDKLHSAGRAEMLEQSDLANLGAWAIKAATGQKTEGTLSQKPDTTLAQDVADFGQNVKEGVKFMVQHPIEGVAEMAKNIMYNPHWVAMGMGGVAKGAAELGKLGRIGRMAAMTGKDMAVGAAAIGAQDVVHQLSQKDHVDWGEAAASAASGSLLIPVMKAGGKAWKAVGKWGEGGEHAETGGAPPSSGPGKGGVGGTGTPNLNRFMDTVSDGNMNTPVEDQVRQQGMLMSDAERNAETTAQELIQSGASAKTVRKAVERNPMVQAALDRQKAADMDRAFEERDAELARQKAADLRLGGLEAQEGRMGPRPTGEGTQGPKTLAAKNQRGEADVKLLTALGLGGLAAVWAANHPEEAEKLGGGVGAAGMFLATGKLLPKDILLKARPELAETTLKSADGHPLVLYHGGAPLQEGMPSRGSGLFADGVYLSSHANRANAYATKGAVYPAYAVLRNPISAVDFMERFGKGIKAAEERAKITKQLREEGYDGVVDRRGDDVWEAVVFDPKKDLVSAVSGVSPKEASLAKDALDAEKYADRYQRGRADPELLAKMGLVAGGALAGGYLLGDHKLLGAVMGAGLGLAAGKGLFILPEVGKITNPRMALAQAARASAVMGVGAYIGNQNGDPILGAMGAMAILAGKSALKPATKMLTDAMFNFRNGNIAAEERLFSNMSREITEQVPDLARREAISDALDTGDFSKLSLNERAVAGAVRNYFDRLGKEAVDADVIKGFRQNYISYIVERDPLRSPAQEASLLQQIFESEQGPGTSASPNTRFGKRGKYESFSELNKALEGSGFKLRTKDVSEIMKIYAKSMRTAIENKILIDSLKSAKGADGELYLTKQDKYGNIPYGFKRMNHPQLQGYGVHPDLVDSMKTVFDNADPNVVTRGLLGLSMAIKRLNVTGSAFHAKSLGEVYINAFGRDAWSARTGISVEPIKHAIEEYRNGGLGDVTDLFIRNGLKVGVPPDISQSIIANVGKTADRLLNRGLGTDQKFGEWTAGKIDFVNSKLDKLTWDTMHTGIKLAIAHREFENLMRRNIEAHSQDPSVPLKSREQIAQEVSKYANDLTGGLDWFRIASEAQTQLGRSLGMYFATPQGQRIAQMIAFAPDWAISTLRAGFQAFGKSEGKRGVGDTLKGLWTPQNTTDLYRKYALRSTLYWLTALNAMNYLTSGHSVFQNKDPTRLEFEDGTSMQIGKHTFESVHAVTDPARFAYNKLGFEPRAVIDFFNAANSREKGLDKYEDWAEKEAGGMLPFVAEAAAQDGLSAGERAKRAGLSFLGLPEYGYTEEQKAARKESTAARKEKKKRRKEADE